jgi:hypothetical protein
LLSCVNGCSDPISVETKAIVETRSVVAIIKVVMEELGVEWNRAA